MNWTARNLFQRVTRKKLQNSTSMLEQASQNTPDENESVSSMKNLLTPKSDDDMTISIGDDQNNIELETDFGTNKADMYMTNPDNNNIFLEKIDQSKVFMENRLNDMENTFYIGNSDIDNDLNKTDSIEAHNEANAEEKVEAAEEKVEADDEYEDKVTDDDYEDKIEADDEYEDKIDEDDYDTPEDTDDEDVEIYSNADLNSTSSSELEMEEYESIREKLDLILRQLFTMVYDTIQSTLKLLW